jgi:hypothetical protein
MARQIQVKPAASLAPKFATRAQNAQGDYMTNSATTTKDQAGNAVAQKAVWVQALADSKTQDRWAKNLTATGTAGWKAGVAAKGTRYGPGAAAGQGKWAAKLQPYFDTLSGLSLPNRLPKGDPGNQAASAQVNAALHAKKISG